MLNTGTKIGIKFSDGNDYQNQLSSFSVNAQGVLVEGTRELALV